MQKVFIVEDDENIIELVIYALKSSGFEAVGFENGNELFKTLENKIIPHLLLLDIMLPESDGLTILKKLRNNNYSFPVIMLTAKSSEFDKVKGLDMGADDYITKPFGIMELISRINAVLRRSKNNHEQILQYQNLSLYPDKHCVIANNNTASLTFKEFELLHYLMMNVGIVLSREKIMGAVWGYDFEGESRTVDMHIKTLRQKLGESGEYIKTIRSVGYKIGD